MGPTASLRRRGHGLPALWLHWLARVRLLFVACLWSGLISDLDSCCANCARSLVLSLPCPQCSFFAPCVAGSLLGVHPFLFSGGWALGSSGSGLCLSFLFSVLSADALYLAAFFASHQPAFASSSPLLVAFC